MRTSNPNPGGDIDGRLQCLLTSTESLHTSCQELHAASAEARLASENHTAELAELRKTSSGLVTATAALLLISQSHKERLDNLDGGNSKP
jgi:hypothetical protein